MDHYLDLRIRPDPEFPTSRLMSALFQKLHLTLVDLRSADIGISFPEVGEEHPTLGACLRVHAMADRLQTVLRHPHLSGILDYLEMVSPAPVPAQTQYRVVRRVQIQSNPERQLRRQMRRHGYGSMEEARQAAVEAAMTHHDEDKEAATRRIASGKKLSLPYVSLRSLSTGQNFRLFIQHCPLGVKATVGSFSAYGLSAIATIPWF